ncbi:MAG: hypothetical protein PHG69_01990 [Candidatus Omnitrophica bacterium]|nr:hypothetical protein [Candidatus Omnitrophota bacterium]
MLNKDSIIKRIHSLSPQLQRIIFVCRDLAKNEKVDVYLVGGFVRDLLLGVGNFDLDIVVEKEGIGFASKLSKILDAQLVKHKDFGTATVTQKDGLKIDIATSRKEFYPEPAALPLVRQGDIGDDLLRRDFTINSIACHIDYDKFGQLVDVCGGLKDLQKGRIRFLHENSFIDDPTRIIRAVRFEQRFGFKIEKDTLKFIKQAKNLKMLEIVQKHRTRDELILIFKERDPYKVLNRLRKVYNLTFIHKDVKLDKKLKKTFCEIDKACEWFKNSFPGRRNIDIWLTYFIILLYRLDLKTLQNFLRQYAFHRGDTKRIISFKKQFVKIDRKLSSKNLSAVKLNDITSPLSYEVIMLVLAVSKNKLTKNRIRDFFIKHHHKKLAITGNDLLVLGVKPGPEFKNIFRKIFLARINGEVCGRQEEIELARKIIKNKR